MKKTKYISLLLVIIMIFQTIPAFAAEPTRININNIEDLFSLNENLNKDASLNTDLELNIDDSFLQRYHYDSIGENQPYTGHFYGNGHTITLNVKTNKNNYALFHYLRDADIENLNIIIENFQTTSNSNNISFSGLAHTIRDTTISAKVLYNGNLNGTKIATETEAKRNITISSIASNCGGLNNLRVNMSKFNLKNLPNNANITYGVAAIIADGETRVSNMANNSDPDTKHAYVIIPANASSYVVGGLIGEVKSGASGKTTGDGRVVIEKPLNVDLSKINNLKMIIGGNIGLVNEYGYGSISQGNGYFVSTEIKTFGYNKEFTLGGYVGENKGETTVAHISSSLEFCNDSVSFEDENISNEAVINIGGIIGKNSGKFINHSTAVNNVGKKVNAKNAIVNFGSIIGHNTNTGIVESNNNGISIQINEMISNENSNFGYMIGKLDNPSKVTVSYNIINAVDENSLRGDYEWIDRPFGGINLNDTVAGFKNNYWGYLDYVELGKQSQVYFTVPMSYFGDNPPEMDANNYPFLVTYDYLDTNENNRYLSFQNKTNRGISTLILERDCVIGIRVEIQVIERGTPNYWMGHYYKCDDILNKTGIHDKPEEPEPPEEDEPEENPDEENPDEDEDEDKPKRKRSKNKTKKLYQAVIANDEWKGEPLPTYITDDDGIVKFNFHELRYTLIRNDFNFDDISEEYYENDIIEAANRLIVKGVGNNKFEPSRPITRAEFATMTVRALGLLPIGEPKFDDVNENDWYYNYINSAASWEIIYGVGENKFEPNDNITREEAILILTRTAENILMENEFSYKSKEEEIEFSATDKEKFSSWAAEGYDKNIKYKIVELRENNNIEPLEPITRAETANAILNLLKNFEVID